jgi:hypothetical protein
MARCPLNIWRSLHARRKVRPNIAEEGDEPAGKRAAPVQQFLDFIFLLPLLFSLTYMRLHYRTPPLPRSAMELSTRMSSLLLYDPPIQIPCPPLLQRYLT